MANDQHLTGMIAYDALGYLWLNGGANALYTGAPVHIYFSLDFYAYPDTAIVREGRMMWYIVKKNEYGFMDTYRLWSDGAFGSNAALTPDEREVLLETIIQACAWRIERMLPQSA